MALSHPTDGPFPSSRGTLAVTTGVVLGLGTLAWMLWRIEQHALAARPRDSAPSRTRKGGLAEGSAISTAATIAAPVPRILDRVAATTEGEALARDLLGEDAASFRPIEHLGDDVVSWRTEDETWLVKLILRPARSGRMTAVTAIVAREDDGSIHFRSRARTRLAQALTRFRMGLEAGELARAR